MLLAGITVTLLQIGLRVKYHLDDPKVVDFNFIQRTRVAFPSVTVCNQNRYR